MESAHEKGDREGKEKSRGALFLLTLDAVLESCVRAYELCVPDTWPDTTVVLISVCLRTAACVYCVCPPRAQTLKSPDGHGQQI